MATEAIPDARRAAVQCLYNAISAIEAKSPHQAENYTLAAIAWIREILPEPSLEPVKEIIWEYRP